MSSSQQLRSLHPTAAAIYRYIIRFKEEHVGESPTRREIAAAMNTSTSIVHYHLVRLDLAGLVVLPGGRDARRIGIPGATWTPPPQQLERKDGGKVGERRGAFEGAGT